MNSEPSRLRISLRDIAKKVGVSHVTVSLALRNHPRISEPMRIKIRQTADEMGYRPDPMLAALAHYRKDKTQAPLSAGIAWINAWPDPNALRRHKEFDFYWQGAFAAAEKFGYRLEEFRLDQQYTPQRLHQILSTRGIAGLLLPPHNPSPDWGDFPWQEYSVVRFGRSLPTPRMHLVTSDQVANSILAFDEIRNLGYKRIGFIINEVSIRRGGHYFEGGFLMAQRTVPEKDRVPVFSFGNLSTTAQARAIEAWILKHKVDAIFTDVVDIPELLAKQKISVPDDIGMAATTVLDAKIDAGINQEPEEIGRVGLLMLNSLINDGSRGVPQIFRQVLVEGSWVNGKSLPSRL